MAERKPANSGPVESRAPSSTSSTKPLTNLKKQLLPYMTAASHLPTPFLSAFLLVHLSAPILANVGGSELSSQVMLLGREYYQGQTTEPLLLFSPLVIHIASSTLKRRLASPNFFSLPSIPTSLASLKPDLLRITAYTTTALISFHFLTNRLYPTTPTPPISSLGPAELDYEFVKYGLHKWPWRSALFYTMLVGGALIHAAEGAAVLWETYLPRVKRSERWKWSNVVKRRVLATTCTVLTLAGMVSIWREDLTPLPSLLLRFDAAYSASFLYRI